LIKKEVEKFYQQKIEIIDSASVVAQYVSDVLKKKRYSKHKQAQAEVLILGFRLYRVFREEHSNFLQPKIEVSREKNLERRALLMFEMTNTSHIHGYSVRITIIY